MKFVAQLTIYCSMFILTMTGCSKSSSTSTGSSSNDTTLPKIVWHRSGLDSCTVNALLNGYSSGIFAGTDRGLYKTTDNGVQWIRAGIDSVNVTALVQYFPTGIIAAGTVGHGMYISTNGGKNWSQRGLTGVPITALHVLLDGTLFAGTLRNGLFRSSNSGTSWQEVDSTIFRFHPVYAFYGDGPILIGSDGIYASTNSGNHWSVSTAGLEAIPFHALNKLSGFTFAGSDHNGMYRADTNSTLFKIVNNNLNDTKIISLCLGGNAHLFAATWDKGVFRSTDWHTWKAVNDGLTDINVRSLLVDNYGYLYAGTVGDGVFKSSLIDQRIP
ncbi:MAG: hypothetical protein WCW40_02445 [Bacteroidota bacterium]